MIGSSSSSSSSINISCCKWKYWYPNEECWNRCLNVINNKKEVDKIMAYKRPSPTVKGQWSIGKDNDSAKASMCGRLLMLWMASKSLSKTPVQLVFSRDSNEKPFLEGYDNSSSEKTYHFNVSHDGDYTIIISTIDTSIESIGIDIMKNQDPRAQTVEEFFKNMNSCFTSFEWSNIKSQPTEEKKLEHFYRHWCLKESYIKADGIGLQLGLTNMEFTLSDDFTTATMLLNGKPTPKPTQFKLNYFDNHIIAHCVISKDINHTNFGDPNHQAKDIQIQTLDPTDILHHLEELNKQN